MDNSCPLTLPVSFDNWLSAFTIYVPSNWEEYYTDEQLLDTALAQWETKIDPYHAALEMFK